MAWYAQGVQFGDVYVRPQAGELALKILRALMEFSKLIGDEVERLLRREGRIELHYEGRDFPNRNLHALPFPPCLLSVGLGRHKGRGLLLTALLYTI